MADFHIESRRAGTGAVVTITGEIDAYTAPQLRERLGELVTAGVERLVLDLRQVSFVDSSGLAVVVSTKKGLPPGDNALCLVIAEGQSMVRKVFEITGVHRLLPIHSTLEAATDDCLAAPAA